MVSGISTNRIGLGLALMALSNAGLVAAEAEDLLVVREAEVDAKPDQQSAPSKKQAKIEPTAFDLAAVQAAQSKRARKQAKRSLYAKLEA